MGGLGIQTQAQMIPRQITRICEGHRREAQTPVKGVDRTDCGVAPDSNPGERAGCLHVDTGVEGFLPVEAGCFSFTLKQSNSINP